MRTLPVILAVAGAVHAKQGSFRAVHPLTGIPLPRWGCVRLQPPSNTHAGCAIPVSCGTCDGSTNVTCLGGPVFGSTKDGVRFRVSGIALWPCRAGRPVDYGTTISRSFCARLTGVVLGSSAHGIVYGHIMLASSGRSCVLVAQCRGAPFVEPGPRVFGYVAVLAEVEDGFCLGMPSAAGRQSFPRS